jgi:tRNA threonylcarbamoyladenosine biosynthesis protein TsaB
MNLLAIDAASPILSVAVAAGDDVRYMDTEAGMKHSELVLDCIDTQMRGAGLAPNDLDGVLCMGGPGSFTGLRIGFSIAKGLALSLGIPFAPIPSLDCVALPHCAASVLTAPVILARKNAFFFALYRGTERIIPYTDASPEEIADVINSRREKGEQIILTGPGAGGLYDALPQDPQGPQGGRNLIDLFCENRGYAKELIALAKKNNIFRNDNTACLFHFLDYIRRTDAEINVRSNPVP